MAESDFPLSPTERLDKERGNIDRMTNRIMPRLRDRTLFKQNLEVYQPGAIEVNGRSELSLLEYSIEGLETYHAYLGRYDYPDQFPVLGHNLPKAGVKRKVEPLSPRLEINVTPKLIEFYKGLVNKYCEPGEDSSTYGETAYVDADIIQMMHERVHIGRKVADAKSDQDPTLLEMSADREYIVSKLQRKDREEQILKDVRLRAGDLYHIEPDMAEEALRWMIGTTLELEVDYILKKQKLQNQ